MRRINYLASSQMFDRGIQIGQLFSYRISERTQWAFLATAFAIFLVAAVSFIENIELQNAEVIYTRAQNRLLSACSQLSNLRTVSTIVLQLGTTANTVAQVRERNMRHLQLLASFGDLMPQSASLLDLRDDGRNIEMHGSVTQATDLGDILARLHDVPHVAVPQLESAHSIGTQRLAGIDFQLRVAEQP